MDDVVRTIIHLLTTVDMFVSPIIAAAHSLAGVIGSNLTRGVDVCVCCPVCRVAALRRADPPSKKSYRLYIRLGK
jgi:hypothetical protein